MKFKLDWKKMTSIATLIVVLIVIMVVTGTNQKKYYEITKPNNKTVEETLDKDNSIKPVIPTDQIVSDEKTEPEKAIVYICGAVKSPKVVELTTDHRLDDAVNEAGGLTEGANKEGANLAMKLADGAQYIIPQSGKELIINYDNEVATTIPNTSDETSPENSNGKININTATAKELEDLTGIGEVISERIVKYRDEHKGFKSIDEIRQIEGIGDKKFENIKNEVTL